MKTFTLAAASTLATAILFADSGAVHPHSRQLQQNGNNNKWRPQNAFPTNNNNNGNNWQATNAGGNQWNTQGATGTSPEAFPQTGGAAVSGSKQAEAADAVQPEGSTEDTTSTAAPAAASTTTEAPAAGADTLRAHSMEEPAQSTIMVLLPDFLAPAWSGSGSTMVLGDVTDSSKAIESGATDSVGASGTEVKSSAATGSPHLAATVLVLASTVVLGLLF
ncbi:hypothetical protein Gpo141_00005815 [Globisporangium polare]